MKRTRNGVRLGGSDRVSEGMMRGFWDEFEPTAQAAQDLAKTEVNQSKELFARQSRLAERVHELDAAVGEVAGVSRSDGETVDASDRRDLSVE